MTRAQQLHVVKRWMVMTLFVALTMACFSTQGVQAQAWKKIKKKAQQATEKSSSSSSSQQSRNISPSDRATAERANELGLTNEQATALLAFYKPIAWSAERFPYEISGSNLQGTSSTKSCDGNLYLTAFELIDWPNLQQKMAQDAAQYPAVFSYYGIEEPGRYGEMPYARNGRKPWEGVSQNAGTLNSKLKTIYEWKGKLEGKERELAQNLQAYLNLSENAQPLEKVDCAMMATRFAAAVRGVQPNNPLLDDLEAEANKALDKQLTNISHLISGPFHKSHLRQIVFFGPGFQLGSESATNVKKVITPGEPTTLAGYFQSSNKDGGGIPTLTWFEMKEDYQERMANGFAEPAAEQYLPMYVGPSVKDEVEAQGHMVFELFPNPDQLTYQSHLQYLPHLHFTKYLLQQLPGTVNYKFAWGKSNKMATGTAAFEITPESREALKGYYAQLMQKKIDAVTFPLETCQDRRSTIVNLSHLDKYGTLLKVDYEQTGDIMYPWPRDSEVQFNTAAGWGAFERTDGRVEVIPLEFRKDPSASRWNWHSVGFTPGDFALTGTVQVQPELVQFGYEMRKANVEVCRAW